VSVLQQADRLPPPELAARTRALAARAQASELGPDDLPDGTFTVTSLGALGIEFFTPIVYPPEVAILGIGRVVEPFLNRLSVVTGQRASRRGIFLNLCCDLRAIDGAPAACFLNSSKRFLELPAALLAFVWTRPGGSA
jgi:pyruvate dehydrogenase E2 component (dihydrolipoamide acetyltransferase)